MDIWEKMYLSAKEQYHPEEVSPFVFAHHVVSAVLSGSGRIFTGFCIESCCGVMDICAERSALLNMYMTSGETKAEKLIVFRDRPPSEKELMLPCGACREFLMQLDHDNRDTLIMTDLEKRKTVKLSDLMPGWWGEQRYEKSLKNKENGKSNPV